MKEGGKSEGRREKGKKKDRREQKKNVIRKGRKEEGGIETRREGRKEKKKPILWVQQSTCLHQRTDVILSLSGCLFFWIRHIPNGTLVSIALPIADIVGSGSWWSRGTQ